MTPEAEQDERDGKYHALVGKLVIVGYTYIDQFENLMFQEQASGWIVDASPIAVMVEDDVTGEVFEVPPVLRNFLPAEPGIHRLRATGRFVDHPDLFATFDVRCNLEAESLA